MFDGKEEVMMNGMAQHDDDEEFARSVQLAEDMAFAENLQRQQQQEQVFLRDRVANATSSSLQTPIIRGVAVPPTVADRSTYPGHRQSPMYPPSTYYNNGNNNSNGSYTQQPQPRLQDPITNNGHSLSEALNDGSASANRNNSLLYVPCEINGRMVEMMVDTGAQSSVISASLMRTLGLEHKLNRWHQGVAAGVGRARIVGRIENCLVSLGHVDFNLYFMVLDIPDDLMLLGIDQLQRFNCLIDLQHRKLIFGGRDGVEVDFLPPERQPVHGIEFRDACTIS